MRIIESKMQDISNKEDIIWVKLDGDILEKFENYKTNAHLTNKRQAAYKLIGDRLDEIERTQPELLRAPSTEPAAA